MIESVKSGGAVIDPKMHHGFSTTRPMTMWDAKTLQVIKMIDVGAARPDGIMFDPYNERVWVGSHMPPYMTVIDAKEGTVVGTVDIGGQAEQATSDGKGTVYVNVMDKGNVAVIDAKTLTVTKHYDLSSKKVEWGTGLSVDAKNHVLFAYYRLPEPQVLILNADNGNIVTTLPTDLNVDTVGFNPNTMEAIATAGAGTLVIVKEKSPTSFEVEQRLKTMPGSSFRFGYRTAEPPKLCFLPVTIPGSQFPTLYRGRNLRSWPDVGCKSSYRRLLPAQRVNADILITRQADAGAGYRARAASPGSTHIEQAARGMAWRSGMLISLYCCHGRLM